MRPNIFSAAVTGIVSFLFELAQRLIEDDGYTAQLQPVRVSNRRFHR